MLQHEHALQDMGKNAATENKKHHDALEKRLKQRKKANAKQIKKAKTQESLLCVEREYEALQAELDSLLNERMRVLRVNEAAVDEGLLQKNMAKMIKEHQDDMNKMDDELAKVRAKRHAAIVARRRARNDLKAEQGKEGKAGEAEEDEADA